MRSPKACIQTITLLTATLLLLVNTAAATAPATGAKKKTTTKTTAKKPSTAHSRSAKSSRTRKSRQAWRSRQTKPESARVKEIQAALIEAHYLDGKPTGVWDARSKGAMQKFQGDNGWQTKRIPDSRALIKLGLGPDRTNLLNPDTAFLAPPEPASRDASPHE